MSPKRQSFVAFCLIGVVFLLLPVIHWAKPLSIPELEFLPLLLLGPAFLIAARIRCNHCGERIAKSRSSVNAGMFLWVSERSCPNCGRDLA
ncbi:MAG: hypothetical protein ACREXY_16690 [Gammaproteobacteria bacterium]